MKVRLILAAICIFTFPMWFSITPDKATINSAPVATVAFAGHINPNGLFCDCRTVHGCICDEGESSVHNGPDPNKFSAKGNTEGSTGFDPGTSALLIALVLLLGLRMRL